MLRVALANWCAVFILGALLGPLQLTLRRAAAGAISGASVAGGVAGGGSSLLGASNAATLLVGLNTIYGCLLANALAWLVLPAARRVRLLGSNMALRRRNFWRRRLARYLLRPLGARAQPTHRARTCTWRRRCNGVTAA